MGEKQVSEFISTIYNLEKLDDIDMGLQLVLTLHFGLYKTSAA